MEMARYPQPSLRPLLKPDWKERLRAFEAFDQARVHRLIVVAVPHVKRSALTVSGWIVGDVGVNSHLGCVGWSEIDAFLEVWKDTVPCPTWVTYKIGQSLLIALSPSGLLSSVQKPEQSSL